MKNLKKIFYVLMLFYFMFHFAGPSIFYWLFGYKETYQGDIFNLVAMKTGFGLNLVTLLIASFAIFITPIKKLNLQIEWKEKSSLLFFLLSVLFSVGVFLTNGDYYNSLKTLYTRTDYLVMGEMFFNLDLYILFGMVYSYNYISESSLFYVFIKILAAARSAPLVLFHYGMCGFVSPIFTKYQKKYLIYLLVAFIFAIFGFNWATKIRNKNIDGVAIQAVQNAEASSAKGLQPSVSEKVEDVQTRVTETMKVSNGLVYQIVGRISYLENTMLPIYYKNSGNSKSMEIFHQKYSLINQFKIFINNIVPGNVFEFDVYPNQYYRSAFLGFTLKRSKEFYTSINLTLPTYVYMSHGFIVSCLISAGIIWFYFILTASIFKLHPLFGVVWLVTFYPGLLTFFDFVTIGKSLVTASISVVFFLILAKIDLNKIFRFNRIRL